MLIVLANSVELFCVTVDDLLITGVPFHNKVILPSIVSLPIVDAAASSRRAVVTLAISADGAFIKLAKSIDLPNPTIELTKSVLFVSVINGIPFQVI